MARRRFAIPAGAGVLAATMLACGDDASPPKAAGPGAPPNATATGSVPSAASAEAIERLRRAIEKSRAPHDPQPASSDPKLQLAMAAIRHGDAKTAESTLAEVL